MKILIDIYNLLYTINTRGNSTIQMADSICAIAAFINQKQFNYIYTGEKGDNNMTQEQLMQLQRIYNTLMTIETKGSNTLIMADCLRALQELGEKVQVIEEDSEKGE